MKLLSIQVGLPRNLGDSTSTDPMDKPWVSGFFKEPLFGEATITRLNIFGDGQADLKNHGGPDKAINVYPAEHLQHWQNVLNLSLPHGAFGENFTTLGLTENEVCIGDVYRLGGVLVQVSQDGICA